MTDLPSLSIFICFTTTQACAALSLVYGFLMANFSWWISRSCMYPLTFSRIDRLLSLDPIITLFV
jgi:hypothetical protein